MATSQSASLTAPLSGEPWIFAPRKEVQIIWIFAPRKEVQIIWIFTAPSIDDNRSKATSCKSNTPVSGGAYQDARKVTLVWNDNQKLGSQLNSGAGGTNRVQALFSPLSFLLREKR